LQTLVRPPGEAPGRARLEEQVRLAEEHDSLRGPLAALALDLIEGGAGALVAVAVAAAGGPAGRRAAAAALFEFGCQESGPAWPAAVAAFCGAGLSAVVLEAAERLTRNGWSAAARAASGAVLAEADR